MTNINEGSLESLRQVQRSNGITYTIKDNKDRFLFPDEYGKFEDALKKRQKFSVRFLLNTGARINEARHVKVEDIDIERKRIVLRMTKAKAKKGEVKGHGRPRIIPISTQFAKYLKGYISENNLQAQDYLNILNNSSLNTAYKKAGMKAELKDYWNISSHTFRKTLEVWLMALGVDSLPLTAHIGHDVKTAAAYYISPDIFSWEDKKNMRTFIGDLYSSHQKY